MEDIQDKRTSIPEEKRGTEIKMSTAVYPGTFDPVTYGHIDIVERTSKLFDTVIIGVLHNSAKTPLFSVDERVNILKKATEGIPNVQVRAFEGLSVDFARECGANVIVRGLRLITDFEYELQMAQTNKKLAPDVDTTFLFTSLQYSYLSSTTVKEVAAFGGDISEFVPPFVAEQIRSKIKVRE
jgi:pantetheine-phosphate adenylyltransferase